MNPKDRNGINKVPLHLIPASAAAEAAVAHLDGALKYGPFNWRSEEVTATVYYAAALRHLNKWMEGEDIDVESGCSHLGHAIAGLNILVDALHGGWANDDRPEPGPGVGVIDGLKCQVERMMKEGRPSTPVAVGKPCETTY